jgi:hypothetical protein
MKHAFMVLLACGALARADVTSSIDQGAGHLKNKQPAEAVKVLSAALKLEPQNTKVLQLLAVALHRSGRADASQKVAKRLLALDPANAIARKILGSGPVAPASVAPSVAATPPAPASPSADLLLAEKLSTPIGGIEPPPNNFHFVGRQAYHADDDFRCDGCKARYRMSQEGSRCRHCKLKITSTMMPGGGQSFSVPPSLPDAEFEKKVAAMPPEARPKIPRQAMPARAGAPAPAASAPAGAAANEPLGVPVDLSKVRTIGDDHEWFQHEHTPSKRKELLESQPRLGDLYYQGEQLTKPHVGRSLLHLMAGDFNCKADLIQIVLDQGTPVDLRDLEGCTPLYYAVEKGRDDVIDLLLRFRANPNARDKWGGTPMFRAAYNGSIPRLEKLVAAGGDITVKSTNGSTLLFEAVNAQNKPMQAYLRKKGLK